MSSAAGPRTALVLGGSSDIGRAVLDALPAGLEHVVLAVRSPDQAPPYERTGVQVTQVVWDALDTEAHRPLLQTASAQLGIIDLVVCAVGLLGHHAGITMGPEQVDLMVRTNFAGPAAALAVAAQHLRDQGSGALVVFSSVAGVRPRRSNYVYGSTKSGLDAFTRGVADALHDTPVQVLVVRPGFVRSSMTAGLDPAPFSTDPATVGSAVARALVRGRSSVVWVPPLLGPLFTVFSFLPASLWRRIAADR